MSAQTQMIDVTINPSVYLDKEAQDKVRNKVEGRGLLWPDTFSEERVIFLPPAASAILVVLCRNHNVC